LCNQLADESARLGGIGRSGSAGDETLALRQQLLQLSVCGAAAAADRTDSSYDAFDRQRGRSGPLIEKRSRFDVLAGASSFDNLEGQQASETDVSSR
jgi:hypothetical protein